MSDDRFVDAGNIANTESLLCCEIKRLCDLVRNAPSQEIFLKAAEDLAKKIVAEDVEKALWAPVRPMIFNAYLPDETEITFNLEDRLLTSWLAADDAKKDRSAWANKLRKLADKLDEL